MPSNTTEAAGQNDGLRIEGLSVAYAGARQAPPVLALSGVDLHIAPGELVVALGASGCGKTTLLNCIAGFTEASAGHILLNGRPVQGAGADRGVVFQKHALMPWLNVRDNVALGLRLRGLPRSTQRAVADEKLELVGLQGFGDAPVWQLSGGMQQRVGIARALASRPKVLLSDEATSALDPETTRSILDLLRQVNRELGLTVVLITHQMQVIKQIADRVAVIDGGRIVEMGPVVEVFTRPQQDITKSLIDEIVPQELPASVLARVRSLAARLAPGDSGQLLRLSYAGEQAYEPILSHLIRELGLDLSILHGQIDEIQEQTFGSLAVYASGPMARIGAAIDYLRAQGVVVRTVDVSA